MGNYCEFHGEEGHETQNCEEFRALMQGFIDNKELQIFEGSSHKREISVLEDEKKGTSRPMIIIFLLGNNEEETPAVPKVIIHKPTVFPYKDSKRLRKQPARISVLALLLSSEAYREALMKLDRLVNNISADNFIYFNDDEIPPGGRGSTKALHITTRCKGYTLPSVLVDNGSALNILPLSTLNRLPIDDSHMKTCQNVVRAFEGTERKVMGRIDIPLEIGPNMYEVDFLVMDIKPSYNCLLGRPWIHSAGVVPSSLH
ncbi:uncharacterized protein [Gossypium hirsutum]|uniref:Gag-pol polyprotein n=1 Tax=Gossypium hirsutum TaxID=3635 RepID=A0ABM2ZBH4_GOSHI|nr:uncharacterized protein LOC121211356 [Gossypium hirsutum]